MKMIQISIAKNKMIKLKLIPYDEKFFDIDISRMVGREYHFTKNGCEVSVEEFDSSVYGTLLYLFVKTDCISSAILAAWYIMKERDSEIENL